MAVEIEDVVLIKKARKVKPIVKVGIIIPRFVYIQPVDLRAHDYKKCAIPVCKTPALYKLGEFDAFFKLEANSKNFAPTIAEALKSLPSSLLEKTVAFDVKQGKIDEFTGEFVCGKVVAYGLQTGEKVPKEIQEQDVILDGKSYTPTKIDNMDKPKPKNDIPFEMFY